MSPFLLSGKHRAALQRHEWFADLPADLQDEVLSHTRRRELAAGQLLCARGDPADGIYVVLEGCIRLSGISLEGRETVLDFYGPGTWFGEVSALEEGTRLHDAEAYGDTLLLHLGKAAMEDLLATSTVFGRGLLRLTSMRLRIMLAALESYSVQTLEQRLANRLLMFATHYGVAGQDGIRIELRLSQETLGRLIGSTRQRVNQIFHEWEAAGIIEQQYGHILLRDVARLESLRQL